MLHILAVMAAAPLNSTMAAGDFKLFGKTYGDWSAAWWQWQERFYPEFGFGEGSVDCRLGQRGPVWFLGGTGGGEAERTCNRPICPTRVFHIVIGVAPRFAVTVGRAVERAGGERP